MGKIKQLILDHKGFKITGTVMLELWGGDIGEIQMEPFILPLEKLTHNNIKRSINDGGFGCKKIMSARIHIYDIYGAEYTQYNRSISLDQDQCQEAFKGILT